MKKTILTMATILMASGAFAAESLNCLVQKFDGQTYNISKDEEITFKGMVDTDKVMIIDEKGSVKVSENANGADSNKIQIGVVLTLGDLVIVSNPVKRVEAIGNKSAILVDHNTGLAIICSKK